MFEWHPNPSTLKQIDRNTSRLIDNFDIYLTKFNAAFARDETFGGPSLYFHFQCISQFAGLSIEAKLQNDRFIEYIYAVLVSWGMHRMGNTATKLRSFREFKHEILSQKIHIQDLSRFKIWELSQSDLSKAQPILRQVLDSMKTSKSEAHLVANTKVLHHLLPDLVPPIDRYYTLRYFGINTMLPSSKSAGSIFKYLFPAFVKISATLRDKINKAVNLSNEDWNTSFTKVIDNAIIGASPNNS